MRGHKRPKISCGDPGKGVKQENCGRKLFKVECRGAGMGLAGIFRGYRNQLTSGDSKRAKKHRPNNV